MNSYLWILIREEKPELLAEISRFSPVKKEYLWYQTVTQNIPLVFCV